MIMKSLKLNVLLCFYVFFGYILHDAISTTKVAGTDLLVWENVILPVLLFSSLGSFAALVGILRNRAVKVEIDIGQIIPYFCLAIGCVTGHIYNFGLIPLIDAPLAAVAILFALGLAGALKNGIMLFHNKRVSNV